MNTSTQGELNIENSTFNEHLKKFGELELHKHYDFESTCSTSLSKPDLIAEFIVSNTPLVFKFDESNMLYYSISGEV